MQIKFKYAIGNRNIVAEAEVNTYGGETHYGPGCSGGYSEGAWGECESLKAFDENADIDGVELELEPKMVRELEEIATQKALENTDF